MKHHRALKLDSSYRPVQILTSRDAFILCWLGKANAIEIHDDAYIHSCSKRFPLPAVIVLNRYVQYNLLELKCTKKNIFWRDNFTCQYCNTLCTNKNITIDHITPRSRGGIKTWENVVTSCLKCNQKKGSKTPLEAKMLPIAPARKPNTNTFYLLKDTTIHNKWLPYLKPH